MRRSGPVDPSRLVAQLTRLGLTSYEARAYVALIRRDSYTAAEVARVAALPRQRIYDVLSSLVDKGLASARRGTQVKYAGVAPDVAIDRLMARQRQELAALERDAAEIVETLTPEFEAGQSQTDPLEYIEVLRDVAAINERFAELQAQVKREILVFTKPPYAKPPQENVEGIEVTQRFEARSIYEASVFEDPDVAEGVRHFLAVGEQARFVERLPLKLVIIDETIVMFGMEDPVANTNALTIVVVEHPSLAGVLKVAFDTIWAGALGFDEAVARWGGDRAVGRGGSGTTSAPAARRFLR